MALSGGTLTVGSVTLNFGAGLAYTLGTGAGSDSLLAINGSLTLNPVITLNVTGGTAWGNGSYALTSGVSSLIDNSGGFAGWTVAGSGLGSHRYAFTLAGDNVRPARDHSPDDNELGRVGRREFRRHGQLERRRDAQRQQCPGGVRQ